ncbi:ribosomal protein S18-alanine N-acetyltransferase [Pelagibacterium montanilacus]|uniref:ribosomal protein S18-alanine N-acetyltransferase n=1 Tax=Pelagibacterium montanilacus TaxID=2185280 RepID=UPI000F8E51C2|nr:ribosomal protein S18-alanine N-acetyltransferase [Pelagibacterium montanilacus]
MKAWLAPAGLHVSYGVPGDAEALAALHAEGFYRGWSTSEFQSYLETPRETPVYAAMNGKRVISGFVLLRIVGDEAEILTVVVARRMRGRGIGHALLRACIDDLMRSPVRSLFLEVDQANGPALALYRSMGFAGVGKREGYYPRPDGSAATALVMRSRIG